MAPIDFKADGTTPRDVQLYQAVQEYHKKEFGNELVFAYYARVLALLAIDEVGESKVMGLLGVRTAIDVCMFHVTSPTMDKAGLKLAEQGRDLMFYRGHSYLADLGNTGNTVLVYVASGAQRYWRRFLKKIGASPADRFQITI